MCIFGAQVYLPGGKGSDQVLPPQKDKFLLGKRNILHDVAQHKSQEEI